MRHRGLLFAPLCRFEFQIGFTFNRTHLAIRRSSRRCSRSTHLGRQGHRDRFPARQPSSIRSVRRNRCSSSSTSLRLVSAWRSRSTVPGDRLEVPGHLRYQACDDKLCYAPVTADVLWTLTRRERRRRASDEPLRGLRKHRIRNWPGTGGRSHRFSRAPGERWRRRAVAIE